MRRYSASAPSPTREGDDFMRMDDASIFGIIKYTYLHRFGLN